MKKSVITGARHRYQLQRYLTKKMQSQIGLFLLGSNFGSATINFFKQNVTLIGTVVVTNLANGSYGVSHAGDMKDIAGISVHNMDPGGIFADNLCYNVTNNPPVANAGSDQILITCAVWKATVKLSVLREAVQTA